MGDIDHRGADFPVQLGEFQPHLHTQFGIEIGERLVEQEHLWLAHDRTADGDTLALTTRQFGWPFLELLLQMQDARRFLHHVVDLCLRRLFQAQREGHVFEHGEMRIKRVGLEHHRHLALGRLDLGDITAFDRNRACRRFLQPCDHAQERRLSAARRPDEDGKIPCRNIQTDIMHDAERAKTLADIAKRDPHARPHETFSRKT